MQLREIRSRAPIDRLIYEVILFSHSRLGKFRFINHQVTEKTLITNGLTYQPAAFVFRPNKQSKTPLITATLTFGAVGVDVKRILNEWRGAARQEPIEFHYALVDDDNRKILATLSMYVHAVTINDNNVSFNLSVTNPLNASCAKVYHPSEWPGLRYA